MTCACAVHVRYMPTAGVYVECWLGLTCALPQELHKVQEQHTLQRLYDEIVTPKVFERRGRELESHVGSPTVLVPFIWLPVYQV